MFEKKDTPKVVSLVALGHSKLDFFNEAISTGNRRGVADEVWVINKAGVVVKHDMLFRMDDLKVKYDCNDKRYSGGSCPKDGISIHETYDEFLRSHNKPIVTSKHYDEYPMSVEYPLEDIINTIGYPYLRTTPAYAAAFAFHIGVKQLRIYGCDYVYPTDRYKGESGRANLEFILGICMSRGMDVYVPARSTLLDQNIPQTERMYGYFDPMDIKANHEKEKWEVIERPEVGKKIREERIIKEREQLQSLMLKYKEEVVYDLIKGKYITHQLIDDILDTPEKAVNDRMEDKND